jgi:CRISPR-associated protein Cmr4
MTTDPVHVGTGGYRLGRVDNSIVREPGTRVPKIPGTSLHGAARSYAARLYENLAAAGQNQKKVDHPATDPVCYTFGYLKEESGETEGAERKTTAYSGVVNVFDAHVILFPVHSMAGPVWVSTVKRLEEAAFEVAASAGGLDLGDGCFTWNRGDPLNLGWLMLGAGGQVTVTVPTEWQGPQWDAIKDRIVLVHEALFSQVVNSNLEIRTSVSIDPEHGAAEDRALFTYEALPRATFLTVEVVLDDYRDSFPHKSRLEGWLKTNGSSLSEQERDRLENQRWTDAGARETLAKLTRLNLSWASAIEVLEAGLRLIEWLGVGGMGTRGFGRIRIVGDPVRREYGGGQR